MTNSYDILIIGGGINGTSIARDAAGRGLKVLLCEKADLASGTSSASTKLIHGGLRYLEHYEFRLVRESLIEREVIMRSAPHLVEPMFFVLPHHSGLRSAWMLRAGLFLYDHLGGNSTLPKTTTVNLRKDPIGACLKDNFTKGFKYADCRVDDARLVVLNALDAQKHGANIYTQTRFLKAKREGNRWRATLQSKDGAVHAVEAKAMVNATRPWVAETSKHIGATRSGKSVRLVKGSHIIVKKLFSTVESYIFQNADGRIIFAIPYQHEYTLIGTTGIPYTGSLETIKISQWEIDYLCAAASEYFNEAITPEHIIHSYSGVRSLFDDGEEKIAEISRDYVLELDGGGDSPPLLSLFGGKITTCRKLAEHALEKLSGVLQISKVKWTANATLPGGDFPGGDITAFVETVGATYPWLESGTLMRLCKAYGTRVHALVNGAQSVESLGAHFGHGLYEIEVRYLVDREWARSADDIFRSRRTDCRSCRSASWSIPTSPWSGAGPW